MGKNATETCFEKALRSSLLSYMKIVEELELVLLIVTIGNFKDLNFQSGYDMSCIVRNMDY